MRTVKDENDLLKTKLISTEAAVAAATDRAIAAEKKLQAFQTNPASGSTSVGDTCVSEFDPNMSMEDFESFDNATLVYNGMLANIYKITHKALGPVIVKAFAMCGQPQQVEKIVIQCQKECETLRNLIHLNIVPLLGVFKTDLYGKAIFVSGYIWNAGRCDGGGTKKVLLLMPPPPLLI